MFFCDQDQVNKQHSSWEKRPKPTRANAFAKTKTEKRMRKIYHYCLNFIKEFLSTLGSEVHVSLLMNRST